MRFCQTDGTPLGDAPESAPPDDPFKTVVGQPPPEDDPFKTVVGGSAAGSKDNDILQLPDEPADPMKTMVVSPEDWKKEDSSAPASEPPPFPEPPKFNEPDLNPPALGDLSPQAPPSSTGDIFGSSGSSSSGSSSSSGTPPFEPPGEPKISDSPFGQPPVGSPFQSPFEQQKSSFEPPPSPFDAPAPPPPPFDAPKPPPFKEPEPQFGSQPSPFDQSPFSQPQSPPSQPVSDPFGSQQVHAEWNPPPVPVQNWQDQNLGVETPFQPPPAAAGQNNTLAVVSLVLGILSFLCLGPLLAIPAIITGYMQRNNIKNNPSEYGGGGMAMAGMILGGIYMVLFVIVFIIYALVILANIR
jgi:hypothetical protein